MIEVIRLVNEELPAEGNQKDKAGRSVEQSQQDTNGGQPDDGKQHVYAAAGQCRHPLPAEIPELKPATRIFQTFQEQPLDARPVTENVPEHDTAKADTEDGKGSAIDWFTQP